MPIDRNNTNTSRPLKPTLATNRTAKTPIVPRLAPSVTSASSTQSSRTPRSNVGSTPRLNTSVREDITPVKAFINTNVTPRSSARKSRVGVGSAQSTPSDTPSGTPIASRPTSTVGVPQKEQGHGYKGLGPSAQNRPRSVVGGNNYNTTPTPRPPLSNIYNHAPPPGIRDPSPMFFHANAARITQEQLPPQKKAAVFFFANGEQDESRSAPTIPSPPLSSVGRTQSESKFFHADSIAEAILTSPPLSVSTDPWSDLHALQEQHSLRPPSPSKENMHLSYRKGVSQVLRPNLQSRNSVLSILSGTHADTSVDNSRRRSSVASSTVRFTHAKSASLSSIDSTRSLKKVPSHELSAITPSPLHTENRVISNGSLPESVASAPTESTETLSCLASSQLLGSTRPGQSVLEHMNELAANARRERKVLDLEISNHSLLAINRSLEKEMRKQKAELRRFRRMSRAGRFSVDTTASNLEEFSAIGVSELNYLSEMSEGEELEEEELEDSSESSFDESTMDPLALEERNAARRSRDEKRLQLDLSKHRELLIDSQKMNQSLKRCMTWTEELIKEGQKALAYNVHASDVRLGGRVLSSEERAEDEENEESRTLLSPWTPSHRAVDPFDLDPLSSSERPERDSGVDLDGMKHDVLDLPGFISPLGSPLAETPSRPGNEGS